MIKKVAVVGATGMLGKPVVRQLMASGFEVAAFVRNPEKARGQLHAGTTIVQGDLKDPESVDRLLKGQDALYINLSVLQTEKKSDWHPEEQGVAILLESAKRNGIRRVVLLSSLIQRYQGMNNFNWWVFDLKERTIEQIRKSGIPYTIFYPSTFMESFLGKYRQGNKILIAGKSESPMYYIAGDDYGKNVAASLGLPENENSEFVIQGPEALTQEDAAVIFLENYKKEKLSISTLPLGVLKFLGKFITPAHYGAHIVEALTKYPEKFESEGSWQRLGKPTITLKAFASGL